MPAWVVRLRTKLLRGSLLQDSLGRGLQGMQTLVSRLSCHQQRKWIQLHKLSARVFSWRRILRRPRRLHEKWAYHIKIESLSYYFELIFFNKGNYFKWFNTAEHVNQSFLCRHHLNHSRSKEVDYFQKKCGAFNNKRNCIDSVACDKRNLVICERDCSRINCASTKSRLKYWLFIF